MHVKAMKTNSAITKGTHAQLFLANALDRKTVKVEPNPTAKTKMLHTIVVKFLTKKSSV